MITAETKLGFATCPYCGLTQKNSQPPTRSHRASVSIAVCSSLCALHGAFGVRCGRCYVVGLSRGRLYFGAPDAPGCTVFEPQTAVLIFGRGGERAGAKTAGVCGVWTRGWKHEGRAGSPPPVSSPPPRLRTSTPTKFHHPPWLFSLTLPAPSLHRRWPEKSSKYS
jgi:hypothetical protein